MSKSAICFSCILKAPTVTGLVIEKLTWKFSSGERNSVTSESMVEVCTATKRLALLVLAPTPVLS